MRRLNELEAEAGPQIEYTPTRIACLKLLGEPFHLEREVCRRLTWSKGYIYTWSQFADWEWYEKLKQLAPTEREWSTWEDSFC